MIRHRLCLQHEEDEVFAWLLVTLLLVQLVVIVHDEHMVGDFGLGEEVEVDVAEDKATADRGLPAHRLIGWIDIR